MLKISETKLQIASFLGLNILLFQGMGWGGGVMVVVVVEFDYNPLLSQQPDRKMSIKFWNEHTLFRFRFLCYFHKCRTNYWPGLLLKNFMFNGCNRMMIRWWGLGMPRSISKWSSQIRSRISWQKHQVFPTEDIQIIKTVSERRHIQHSCHRSTRLSWLLMNDNNTPAPLKPSDHFLSSYTAQLLASLLRFHMLKLHKLFKSLGLSDIFNTSQFLIKGV